MAEGMSTGVNVPKTEVPEASAPPAYDETAQDAPPVYPVLAPGQKPVYSQQPPPQQPQQMVYANPQQPAIQMMDESKQLDNDIANKFDSILQTLSNTKNTILTQCQTANTEQKKDILQQLQSITNTINTIKIDPNIQPKPKPMPQPIPQQQNSGIIIVQQQPMIQQNVVYISDTWNTNVAHPNMIFNVGLNRVSRKGKKGWLNAFGNQIVSKGQYKKWSVQIIPKVQPKKARDAVADVVVGVVNSDKISGSNGAFWLGPFLGYGYYGWSGKKFHTNKKGKNYASKFNVNDKIDIEVNMSQFELAFYVNGVSQGKAFPIDARWSYTLAVALCNEDYEIQIC